MWLSSKSLCRTFCLWSLWSSYCHWEFQKFCFLKSNLYKLRSAKRTNRWTLVAQWMVQMSKRIPNGLTGLFSSKGVKQDNRINLSVTVVATDAIWDLFLIHTLHSLSQGMPLSPCCCWGCRCHSWNAWLSRLSCCRCQTGANFVIICQLHFSFQTCRKHQLRSA